MSAGFFQPLQSRINMNCEVLTIPYLERIVQMLRDTGECHIVNCGGTISLMEIGAYLAEVSKEAVKVQQCQT